MLNNKYAGVAVCAAAGLAAHFIAGFQNVIGAPMIGLIIGMIAGNCAHPGEEFLKGTRFCSKKVLNAAIVIAGATLDISQVAGAGAKSLPLLITNIGLAFLTAALIGKKLGMTWNARSLVGAGTCICGGTAIAAIASVIKAKEEEIAYAMTAIFFFDIFAAVIFPYLAGWLGLSPQQFGVLAGSAINDTSSVAAAEATYSALNGVDSSFALTVKLTRTALLIFVALAFAMIQSRRENRAGAARASVGRTVLKAFPWFILCFVGAAVLNSFGVFDAAGSLLGLGAGSVSAALKAGFKYLTAVALCGVGFKIRLSEMFTKGWKPVVLGGTCWLVLASSSLIFVSAFARYING